MLADTHTSKWTSANELDWGYGRDRSKDYGRKGLWEGRGVYGFEGAGRGGAESGSVKRGQWISYWSYGGGGGNGFLRGEGRYTHTKMDQCQ